MYTITKNETTTTHATLSEIPDLVEYLSDIPMSELSKILRSKKLMTEIWRSCFHRGSLICPSSDSYSAGYGGEKMMDDVMAEIVVRRREKKIKKMQEEEEERRKEKGKGKEKENDQK